MYIDLILNINTLKFLKTYSTLKYVIKNNDQYLKHIKFKKLCLN